MAEFGEELRKAREAKGMTQQTLADKVNVTRQTVSRWELGDRYPDIFAVKRLSQVLEKSVGELLSAEDPSSLSESVPLVEDRTGSELVAVLYGGIALLSLSQLISFLMEIGPWVMDLKGTEIMLSVVMVLGRLGMFAPFVFGAVAAARGTLTRKASGIVAVSFFLSQLLVETAEKAIGVGFNHSLAFFLLSVWLIGAVSHYMVHIKEKCGVWSVVSYMVCAWGLSRSVFGLLSSFIAANSYFSVSRVFMTVLHVSVYILFIYQTRVVSWRHRSVASTTSLG